MKCSKCKETKEPEEFYNNSVSKNGKASQCISCATEVTKDWGQRNAERLRRNNYRIKYGITVEQYDSLLKEQNFCCAICDRHESEFKRRLAVDHNHVTREIRGLLCNYCNHRVVGRHRDGAKLRKIADYIEQGTGWFVPVKKKTPRKRRKLKK